MRPSRYAGVAVAYSGMLIEDYQENEMFGVEHALVRVSLRRGDLVVEAFRRKFEARDVESQTSRRREECAKDTSLRIERSLAAAEINDELTCFTIFDAHWERIIDQTIN
ncbi:hypothetical protein QLX08_003532 [Tetragonisca angustula]|uniref:Uncharacterized protein n=1 Tax=Tetragonisca angustula TaxID=166442 RepID=A0AAW1A618_9HYME